MSRPAVIFDLDDTLFAERDYVFSGFRAVAEWADDQLRIPQDVSFVTLQRLYQNGVHGNTFNVWLQEEQSRHDPTNRVTPGSGGMSEEQIVTNAVSIYRDHIPIIAPRPETTSMLRQLSSDYRLGLLSDGYLSVQQKKLDALELASFFEVILFSDSLGRDHWKPSPKPYQEVLASLDVSPSAAIYVGDNPDKDFLGARRAGLASVRVRYADGVYAKNEPCHPEGRPDFEIDSLDRLPSVLSAWRR